MMNTYEELAAATLMAQRERLNATPQGRSVLTRLRYPLTPQFCGDETTLMPPDLRARIHVNPTPRHMNPHFHVKRRQARAAILRKRQDDADTYFTDARLCPRVAQRQRTEVDDAFEELTEEEFWQHFRLSKQTVHSLCDELDPVIGCQRASGLSTERKVCNAELRILVVVLWLPGSCHDSWVWQHNSLRARLAAQLQPGEYLLGAQLRLVPGSAPSPGCPPEPLLSSAATASFVAPLVPRDGLFLEVADAVKALEFFDEGSELNTAQVLYF
ncbi:hypothetical protein HPB49_004501 [Dermacentor silvarum]|uniref:Uncharacterized protein n=1 Tax=Dermacentor silvarum TaxID=543639 RepID=A0ACB8DUU2_DERSI|nr:hypothetical protein HPB49_004501 [Dermacentor silvarum]